MKTLIVLFSVTTVVFGSTVRVFNPDPVTSDPVKVAEHASLNAAANIGLIQHELLANPALRNPGLLGLKNEAASVVGFLKNVAVPAAEAKKKAELERLNNQRIVGGAPVEAGVVPWQAALIIELIGSDGLGVCGASLVSNNRLITAAHCWTDGINQAWKYTVILGSVNLFTGNDGVRQDTSVVVPHPNWIPLLLWNDTLSSTYRSQLHLLVSTISPVSLPNSDELSDTFAGYTAYASGFGITSDGGGIPADQTLSQVTLEVIANGVCWWSFPFFVYDSNICTSGEDGGSPCSGDSGGPLVTVSNDRTVLIGVVSFGSAQGCEKGHPAVYTRVTYYMDFIEEHLA